LIGNNQSFIGGQHCCWKVYRDSKIKLITPFQIVLPFRVGLKIFQAGFDLDNRNLSLRIYRSDICSPTCT